METVLFSMRHKILTTNIPFFFYVSESPSSLSFRVTCTMQNKRFEVNLGTEKKKIKKITARISRSLDETLVQLNTTEWNIFWQKYQN